MFTFPKQTYSAFILCKDILKGIIYSLFFIGDLPLMLLIRKMKSNEAWT